MYYKRLKELRLKYQLTKREVAKALNVSESTYGKWELGQRKPDLDTISRLADYYCVSTDYLLGNSDDPNYSEIKHAPPLDAEARVNKALEDIGLLKAGEELTVEEQMIIADFLIRNKDIILPDKKKKNQTDK